MGFPTPVSVPGKNGKEGFLPMHSFFQLSRLLVYEAILPIASLIAPLLR